LIILPFFCPSCAAVSNNVSHIGGFSARDNSITGNFSAIKLPCSLARKTHMKLIRFNWALFWLMYACN